MHNPVSERHTGDWKTATERDIYYCYRLILDREPDVDGWNTFTTNVEHGMSVQSLVSCFLNSAEFRNKQAIRSSGLSPVLVELDAFKIYVYPPDSPTARSIIDGHTYEPHVTAAIERLVKPGMVFVDIGANLGYLSLVAARVVGERGKVICFEPNQENCKLIYLSAKLNGFENIEIYPFALADENKAVIYDDMEGNGIISAFDSNLESTPLRSIVRALTLDSALRDEDSIDVLKMDIEGAEYMVMRGAAGVLKRHRPVILSEFSPPGLHNVSGVSGEEFLRLFVAARYDISVLGFDNEVIECGDDIEKVFRYYTEQRTSHIDIVAFPR
jgi:FkbM family methyltransferase